MPTNRKRIPRSRSPEPEIEKWKIHFLETREMTCGKSFISWDFQYSREQQREVWQQFKDQILKKWIRKYPGTRPYAWWQFETVELRIRFLLDGASIIRNKSKGESTSWGISDYFDDPHNLETEKPSFESQSAYLKRHKLLPKSEEKRLKPADFEPETWIQIRNLLD